MSRKGRIAEKGFVNRWKRWLVEVLTVVHTYNGEETQPPDVNPGHH